MTNTFTLPVNHLSALISIAEESTNEIHESSILDELVSRLSFTVVKRVDYAFESGGKTIVYILSQSHLILHTWPEYNLFHIDLVSCTDVKKEELETVLADIFKDQKTSIKVQSMLFQ